MKIGDKVQLTQISGHIVTGTVHELIGGHMARVWWDEATATVDMKSRVWDHGPTLGIAVPLSDLVKA